MTATLAPDDAPPAPPPPSRLRPRDLVGTAWLGLRTRRLRAGLTALGIAIGIAALVAVIGVSSSSRAQLLSTLDELGTDLLRVAPGLTVLGEDATLPDTATAMVDRIGPVTRSSATTTVESSIRRSDQVPASRTNAITVMAAETTLAEALRGDMAHGRFLDAATEQVPAVVLGSVAARRLGITDLTEPRLVAIGNETFQVVGILEPFPLAPEIDRAAMVGYPVAGELFDTSTSPGTLYVRTTPTAADDVRRVLPATVSPGHPEQVDVSRPSDALAARDAVDTTMTTLLLVLGGVALLVGAVGIANVQIIAVLERRTEIGVRRALGARQRHVAWQFLVESSLLAALGGVGGVAVGTAVTAVVASNRGWSLAIPASALAGGVAVALAIGALAGLVPAARAARLDPALAVRPRA